jgi:hypothetical protein
MVTNPKIIAELERIAKEHGGCLRPENVVTEARVVKSPLHSWFTWENTEAAHQWRLYQARQLIRVVVTYAETPDKTPSRVFVSLTPDRPAGNGYRSTVSVMSNEEHRKQLLADALDEMDRFKAKYAALQELAGVFRAMDRSSRRLKAA